MFSLKIFTRIRFDFSYIPSFFDFESKPGMVFHVITIYLKNSLETLHQHSLHCSAKEFLMGIKINNNQYF